MCNYSTLAEGPTRLQWNKRLAELIGDWCYVIRRDGWQVAWRAIGQEILALPYKHSHFVIVARSLLEPLPALVPKLALEIRPIEPADLKLLRQIDRPSEARAFAVRLACGHKGLLALYQGQPAGYAWGSAEVNPALERVRLKLEPGDALCVDAYTVPAFRGRGIQTALSLARFRLFRDLGYRRAVAYIEKHNAPSLTVWRNLGGQEIGQIDYLRIGPWRRSRYQ